MNISSASDDVLMQIMLRCGRAGMFVCRRWYCLARDAQIGCHKWLPIHYIRCELWPDIGPIPRLPIIKWLTELGFPTPYDSIRYAARFGDVSILDYLRVHVAPLFISADPVRQIWKGILINHRRVRMSIIHYILDQWGRDQRYRYLIKLAMKYHNFEHFKVLCDLAINNRNLSVSDIKSIVFESEYRALIPFKTWILEYKN
jgi:hypothetical protein